MDSRTASRLPRRGFTLIELLMVIVVIGILVGLLSLAVGQALSRAKVTRIKVELDQLSTAMDRFAADHGGYPPNSKNFALSGAAADREARLMRFLRKAFPRWVGDYSTLQTLLLEATESPNLPAATPPHPPQADIENLDQAELLVFFLGGIPVRREDSAGEVGFELTGFAADPQNPFRHADINIKPAGNQYAAITQRTTLYFEFDVRRLVDRDRDGWPEYVPQGTAPTGEMPPFVYFGSQSYQDFPIYPSPLTQSQAFAAWGLAVPYTSRFDPNNNYNDPVNQWGQWQMEFVNPKKFQIVAAGVDGQYGINTVQQLNDARNLVRIFPSGENYSDFDLDNLTNFTDATLEEARP